MIKIGLNLSSLQLSTKTKMFYQYLRADNDKDNTAPKLCAQSAGNAASKADAEHQSYKRQDK